MGIRNPKVHFILEHTPIPILELHALHKQYTDYPPWDPASGDENYFHIKTRLI